MTGRRVASIEVDGGRVHGVKAVDHRGQALSVEAPVVISAAGAVHGIRSLLPEAYREHGESLQALDRKAPCCVVIYFGLATEVSELGAGVEQMWLAESSDAEVTAPGDGLFEDDTPIACQLKLPKPEDQDRNYPTAQAIVYVDPDRFSTWADTGVHQRGQAYETLKRRLSERVLNLIEAELPGFRAQVRQTEVATPLSFAHFAGSSRGAALGLPHTNDRYATPGISLRTSIAGLYLAGSDVFHGGVGGAAISGLLAAGASMGGWLQLKLARPWLS